MTTRPRSLRARLLLSGAIFIALALAATGIAVELALHRFVQGQIDQRLDGQLLTMASALVVGDDGRVELARSVDGPPFDNPHTGWFWLIRTPTHTWMAGGLPSGGLSSADVALPSLRPGPLPHPETLDGTGPGRQPVRARADRVRIGGNDVVIVAAAPLAALAGPLRDALTPLFTALLVLGAGLIAATLGQVRVGLRPLGDLRDAIAAVRTGGIERIPSNQPDEIRPVVGELNSLLDQHAANLERARRHVANLAHGLKTPLAGLALGLEAPGADAGGTLRALVTDMDRRVRHHLARARIAALGSAARARLPLEPRLRDHVGAFTRIYADRAIGCALAIPPDLAVACDPEDLDEMVGNLLDNAFKWARSAVRISAEADGQRVRCTVADDGPGLSSADRDAVLQRGRRLDESVAGDGFGLSIVHEVVELYGGSLHLADNPEGGLAAILDLPRAAP